MSTADCMLEQKDHTFHGLFHEITVSFLPGTGSVGRVNSVFYCFMCNCAHACKLLHAYCIHLSTISSPTTDYRNEHYSVRFFGFPKADVVVEKILCLSLTALSFLFTHWCNSVGCAA